MRRVVVTLLLALGLLGTLTPALWAQEDEFEEISAEEKAAIANPEGAADSHHHAEGPWQDRLREEIVFTRVWLVLPLILAGTLVFFARKWLWKYLVLGIALGSLGFWYEGCPCVVGTGVRLLSDPWRGIPPVGPAILLGTILLTTLFVGRMFCGYACPLGAAQEFLAFLRKVIRKTIQVPFAVEKRWRWSQWVVLIALAVASAWTAHYVFEDIDPFRALFARRGTVTQWALAAVLFPLCVFMDRPFCRFLCPVGPWLQAGSRWSLYRLRKTSTCNNCGLCRKRCPVNAIDSECVVENAHCVRCGECVKVCKREGVKLCRKVS
jgi:ferredoxin